MERTEDGRHVVVDGRRWRASDLRVTRRGQDVRDATDAGSWDGPVRLHRGRDFPDRGA